MTSGARAIGAGVPLAGLRGRVVYLLGPGHGTPAERDRRFLPAWSALRAAGCEVVCPGLSPASEDADALLSVVGDDLDALASAAAVVFLPGSERLWEYTIADTLGVRLVPFADCVVEVRSA